MGWKTYYVFATTDDVFAVEEHDDEDPREKDSIDTWKIEAKSKQDAIRKVFIQVHQNYKSLMRRTQRALEKRGE